MGYYWNCEDDAKIVKDAAENGVTWAGIITRDDGYGGYNTNWRINNSLYYLHVHFKQNGTRVNVIRSKSSSSDPGGDNLIKFNDKDKPLSLSDLAFQCNEFPNHKTMLLNIKAAMQGVKRNARNELEDTTP